MQALLLNTVNWGESCASGKPQRGGGPGGGGGGRFEVLQKVVGTVGQPVMYG